MCYDIEDRILDFADNLGLCFVELNDDGDALFYIDGLEHLPGLRVCPSEQQGLYHYDRVIAERLMDTIPTKPEGRKPSTVKEILSQLGQLGFLEVTYLNQHRKLKHAQSPQGA